MSELNELLDKTIENIYLNKERDFIVFKCSDGIISYNVRGDCCSVSWIEHLCVPNLPFTVSFTQEHCLGIDKQDIRDEHEVVAVYQTILIDFNNKQSILIEYRNDSNGYYGGYLFYGNQISIIPPELEDMSEGYNCDE
jgi:hypothetical protein